MPDWTFIITAGIILIVLGFFLIAIGIMRSAKESAGPDGRISDKGTMGDRVKGGGVIFIGPIPIVFGTDKRSAFIAMLLAIVLMLLAIWFLK